MIPPHEIYLSRSGSGNEFLRNQPNDISASDAQALKTGTYRQLKSKSYGEMKSATIASQKALTRDQRRTSGPVSRNCKIERERGRTSLDLDDALEAAVNSGMIQLESSRSAKRVIVALVVLWRRFTRFTGSKLLSDNLLAQLRVRGAEVFRRTRPFF
jgi:hypothetical protein